MARTRWKGSPLILEVVKAMILRRYLYGEAARLALLYLVCLTWMWMDR